MNCYSIYLAYIIILTYCLWPTRYASNYEYITGDMIYDNLLELTTKNLTLLQENIKCDYTDILNDNQYMYISKYWQELYNLNTLINTNAEESYSNTNTNNNNRYNIRLGGEYYPNDCQPKFSTAIIVCYRQREEQLNTFLIYMHNFLRKQNIHYRIFIIEQYDQKPFNRAKLFNIGALYSMKLEFPCLILHDVDLLPMRLGQLYACTQQPRHMCSSLDKFRFNLPYRGLFGGAVAIPTTIFAQVNGMSNVFYGWGGEDDDFYGRLEANNIDICRFEPNYSLYTMLKHKMEIKNPKRLQWLREGPARYHTDGINSLEFKERGYRLHSLFTHILVET